jgi:hypothetical protein
VMRDAFAGQSLLFGSPYASEPAHTAPLRAGGRYHRPARRASSPRVWEYTQPPPGGEGWGGRGDGGGGEGGGGVQQAPDMGHGAVPAMPGDVGSVVGDGVGDGVGGVGTRVGAAAVACACNRESVLARVHACERADLCRRRTAAARPG